MSHKKNANRKYVYRYHRPKQKKIVNKHTLDN